MGLNKEVNLIVSVLLLVSASAFAQPGYQPPGPPFYVYDVPLDANGNLTKPTCMSADGNIPDFATIPGGNIATVAMGAQTNATNGGFSPPCSTGSSFTSTGTGFSETGNLSITSATDTSAPYYSPAFGPNTTGIAAAQYEQQFYAPPGSQIQLTYTINGNGFAYIAVVSPCPSPPLLNPDGSVVPCTQGSSSATPSYGGVFVGPPTANHAIVQLAPFTVSSMGTYVVGIQVFTGRQYPFPYYQDPNTISATAGCGVGASLTGNGTPTVQGIAQSSLGQSLKDAATACGYDGFNWQQYITNLPCPSPFVLASSPSFDDPHFLGNYCYTLDITSPTPNGLFAPPTFLDTFWGGYTVHAVAANSGAVTGNPSPAGAYNPAPLYWDTYSASTPDGNLPLFTDGTGGFPVNTGNTLKFVDTPADPCLPTPVSSPLTLGKLNFARNKYCGGAAASAGSFLGFATYFVGVSSGQSTTNLFQWTWTDTFNGLTMNVAGLSSVGSPDPGSGAGYVTITSINGVPVPPIIPPTQVSATASGLAYSRVSKTFNGTVTITNISGTTLTTPTSFQLALNSLTAGVTLFNSTGTFNQGPFITIPALVSMAPGQSVTVAVQFSNPSNAVINFTPEFYAGSFQ